MVDRFRALPTARVLGLDVPVAVTRRARLLGLALLARRRAPRGLLIPRCCSIHTFGMRFALDVVFLGRDGEIASVRSGLPPRRFARCPAADAALELPAGTAPRRIR
jgi:uncharacterized membrane protein (UPF0127 family)